MNETNLTEKSNSKQTILYVICMITLMIGSGITGAGIYYFHEAIECTEIITTDNPCIQECLNQYNPQTIYSNISIIEDNMTIIPKEN